MVRRKAQQLFQKKNAEREKIPDRYDFLTNKPLVISRCCS